MCWVVIRRTAGPRACQYIVPAVAPAGQAQPAMVVMVAYQGEAYEAHTAADGTWSYSLQRGRRELAKGMRGVVVGQTASAVPIVRLLNGGQLDAAAYAVVDKELQLSAVYWETAQRGWAYRATVKFCPLRPGWAITGAFAQGVGLGRYVFDVDDAFVCNANYTTLGRATDLQVLGPRSMCMCMVHAAGTALTCMEAEHVRMGGPGSTDHRFVTFACMYC